MASDQLGLDPEIMTTREVILDGGSPWGFRMHGGIDVLQPLRISRVSLLKIIVVSFDCYACGINLDFSIIIFVCSTFTKFVVLQNTL